MILNLPRVIEEVQGSMEVFGAAVDCYKVGMG